MKRVRSIAMQIILLGTVVLSLAGCGLGSGKEQVAGLSIDKDMAIEACMISEFDESLYSVSELQTMINNEIADYSAGAGSITVGDVTVQDGILTAYMNYGSAADYSAFNGRTFMIMDVPEAIAQDVVRVALRDIKADAVTNIAVIEDAEKLVLVVTDEVGRVQCPGNVLYISDGVEVVSSKAVDVTDNMDGLAYIIFKK